MQKKRILKNHPNKKCNNTFNLYCYCIEFAIAFNSNQTAKQYLKDNKLRKEIMIGIVNNQPYTDEMMEKMLKNDSCKQTISHRIMHNADIMSIVMNK